MKDLRAILTSIETGGALDAEAAETVAGLVKQAIQMEQQKAQPTLLDSYPGLETIYSTPHVCGYCSAHISDEWDFCPECATPVVRDRTTNRLR